MSLKSYALAATLLLSAPTANAEVAFTWPIAGGPTAVEDRAGNLVACRLRVKVDTDLADHPEYVRFADPAGVAWCLGRATGECVTVGSGPDCTMVIGGGTMVRCMVAQPGGGQVNPPALCGKARATGIEDFPLEEDIILMVRDEGGSTILGKIVDQFTGLGETQSDIEEALKGLVSANRLLVTPASGDILATVYTLVGDGDPAIDLDMRILNYIVQQGSTLSLEAILAHFTALSYSVLEITEALDRLVLANRADESRFYTVNFPQP